MSTYRHIDRICAAAMALALVLLLLFVNGEALGIQASSRVLGYEARLFDNSRVHTLAIVMDDWEEFIENCQDETYASCSLVIDDEAFSNAAIRAKGNTSLSMVSAMDSSRYSFKIEFDHYDSGASYHGLDKLCLNNLIQDNTGMKDYLVYQMMAEFGANAPLCSFVYVTVNGQDWGLYLAVEAIEESFLQRNYGRDYGELYKPDSMDLGGGRGNGRNFNMEDITGQEESGTERRDGIEEEGPGEIGFGRQGRPVEFSGELPPEMARSGFSEGQVSGGFPGQNPDMGGGFGGGMGSQDTKLQYVDGDPASYANIFDSAKTDVDEADQARLIEALRRLSGGEAESALDVEQVLRYFVVHNYVVNGDSYTGSLVHNYYLYEKNGLLAMLPWDYNLAFGGFQTQDASAAVNDPIDTPLSVTGSGDRPMMDWILQSEAYTERYHQMFREFLDTVDPVSIIDRAYELIAPYMEKDPTKFCTYEEFETGVETLRQFCALRSESVSGQLAGDIPSTKAGQAGSSALVDASELELSDMGNMSAGGMGAGGMKGGFGRREAFSPAPDSAAAPEGSGDSSAAGGEAAQEGRQGQPFPDGGQKESGEPPEGPGELPENSAGSSGAPEEVLSLPAENPDGAHPDASQAPEGSMERFPGREMGENGSLPEAVPQEENRGETWFLLALSGVVLAGGLIGAAAFKRRN